MAVVMNQFIPLYKPRKKGEVSTLQTKQEKKRSADKM
jgi:hypothetical protein